MGSGVGPFFGPRGQKSDRGKGVNFSASRKKSRKTRIFRILMKNSVFLLHMGFDCYTHPQGVAWSTRRVLGGWGFPAVRAVMCCRHLFVAHLRPGGRLGVVAQNSGGNSIAASLSFGAKTPLRRSLLAPSGQKAVAVAGYNSGVGILRGSALRSLRCTLFWGFLHFSEG